MRKPLLLLALAAVAVAIGIAVWDARREVLVEPQGYAADGRALGVTIGEPFETAEADLLQLSGVQRNGLVSGRLCIMRRFGDDVVIHHYVDSSWRNGVICLAEREGRVIEVVWEYAFFVPIF